MADDAEARDSTAASTHAAPAERGRRPLARGDTLAGRFVIVQFLAAGGMGEVYEAADLQLQGKHCALKTLKPSVAGNPELRLRFEREVLLAREVTHPNVCPTYDIFQVPDTHGPLTFFTMKLLRGESLAARLKRSGPIPPAPLAMLARQMADALDAAHRAGVVHRDFKPGNVMLEHSGTSDMRVCITDFGLSRAHESDMTLGDTGQIIGTPGYIAPELIQGRVASFSADVYAFGVVLYEMATGQKPVHASATSGLVRPSTLIPDLPRVWDRLILGCLEPDPGERFQSAGEAMAVLESEASSSQIRSLRARVRRRQVWLAGALTIGVAAAAAWFAVSPIQQLLHPLPAQRFVALMPWPPATSPEQRPLVKGVLDAIGSRLSRAENATKDLLIISQSDVSGASLAAPVDAVGALGANLVLAASSRLAPDGMTLHLAVLDASTSKTLRATDLQVLNTELNHLPDRAAVAAAALLDVRLTTQQWADQEQLSGVAPEAYQFFARGEELAGQPNETDVDRAIEQYQHAIERDARFALAYAKLSIAYTRKFRATKEVAFLNLASRNADLGVRINPLSGWTMLGHAIVHLESGRTEEAMDELRRALTLDPGNPQIRLNQALVLRNLDRRDQEADVYRAIVQERPNYWPAYNQLGQNLYRRGQFDRAAEAFAEGSAVAPRVAQLFTNRGAAELSSGKTQNAEQSFRHSIQLTPTEIAYSNLGTIAFSKGEYQRALENYQKASGLSPRNDAIWRNIGDCYAMLHAPERVRESYTKAAELLSTSLSINPRRGSAWITLAFYEAKLGHQTEAETALRSGEQRGATDLRSQFRKAQALVLLGRHDQAVDLVVSCLQQGLSPTEVELALDLKEVERDPRYRRQIALLSDTSRPPR